MRSFLLLISLTLSAFSQIIGLSDLVLLASKDIGKKIIIAKDVSMDSYSINIDLAVEYEEGALFNILKTYLSQNNMSLIDSGSTYIVAKNNYNEQMVTLPKIPLAPDSAQKHYYMYKVKHITNHDVAKVLSIFTDEFGEPIKYVYLKQSDMIAYASTPVVHQKIRRLLIQSDNSVRQRMIKITFFTLDTDRAKEFGSVVNAFSYNFGLSSKDLLSDLFGKGHNTTDVGDVLDFRFLLHALQSRGIVKVFQEPKVYLTNGVTTTISYAKNIGYKESTTVIVDNKETSKDSIKYRDVGFKLVVFPKIGKDWVFLDLSLVSETLLSLKENIPLTQKTTYHSKVKVYAGKPLLLSGIRKVSDRSERSGIPLLSDLPIVGSLFRYQSQSKSTQTINILIEVL